MRLGGRGLRGASQTGLGCWYNVNEDVRAAWAKESSLAYQLDALARQFECKDFIGLDPISLPHRYSARADIEIAGFIAAMFAWGQRPTVIAKSTAFLELLDDDPHAFIVGHSARDRQRFAKFVHRTFQPEDALYVLDRLQRHYREHASLESMFTDGLRPGDADIQGVLTHFHEQFFDSPTAPERSRKHLASPARSSSCKRLNMYLRWMVRSAKAGVDFGLWTELHPRQLVIPLDVHVMRMSTELGLLQRMQADWKAAIELTEALRTIDSEDPVRFDFALFGLGIQRNKARSGKAEVLG